MRKVDRKEHDNTTHSGGSGFGQTKHSRKHRETELQHKKEEPEPPANHTTPT